MSRIFIWATLTFIFLLTLALSETSTTAQGVPVHDHAAMAAASDDSSLADSTGSFFGDLFKGYTPRRFCMNNEPDVIWLHFWSDLVISLAYFTIPAALIYFVRRRNDLAFNWMFVMFAVFILACGSTHVLSVIALWRPVYRFDGVMKLVTAIASIGTAIALWRLIPRAVALPSPALLRATNQKLETEITERRIAEEKLKGMHGELEHRVQERTQELATINTTLHEEIVARTKAEKTRDQLLDSERAARIEVERASRAKDEFLAVVSHELRTPLNAILGWSQILGKDQSTNLDLLQGLETIERNARMQSQLIDDLLDMSRIMSGKIRLDVQRVDIVSVIESAIESVKPAAEAKGIHLHSVLDPKARPVAGDPNRLQQVIWNLLSNSVKFTPKGGRVQILLERINSHVEINVTDNGEGISAGFLPHVFERFRQQDASSSRRHSGLGLGLSIVRQLVEMHGGTVQAKSDGEGKGATFSIHLPVAALRGTEDDRAHPEVTANTVSSRDHEDLDLRGISVLAVDDDNDSRILVKRILEDCGAEVRVADSAATALEAFKAKRPTILLSDIGMPGQDGYALIHSVRALGAGNGGDVPAAALTAFARADDRRRALMAGFQSHIVKPVDAGELVAVVASLAGRMGGPTTSRDSGTP